jgi:asparagine synthase (glutamine-hydrolysing)
MESTWSESGGVSILRVRNDGSDWPEVASCGSLIAVGLVRLENRDELARRYRRTGETLGDLDLVLRHYRRLGARAIRDLIGDFSFVIADTQSGTVLAARDAFGVRTLYVRRWGDVVVFSSRAEALADHDRYDEDYLVEFAAGVVPDPHRTPYAGVTAVPPASMALTHAGAIEFRTYWRPTEFESGPVNDEQAAIEEFRGLLTQAVRVCLTDDGRTWSELSGGLDSSSIVCIAETLKREGKVAAGIAGTITYADSVGAGSDERVYSDSVVKTFDVRNEVLIDYLLLQATSPSASTTDTPSVRSLLAARDIATLRILRESNARVLLSGIGSDHYLVGNMFFFADWIAKGESRRAVSEMLRWAALGRVSFWELAYLNALLPLVPAPARTRLARGARVPSWIAAGHHERLALSARSAVAQSYGGQRGRQYAHEVAFSTGAIALAIDHGLVADAVEMRYPFCHRPLVEFALRLPPDMCRRPNARKWVLREAMRGCLPEIVRTRRWKGAFDGRIAWSLLHESARFEPLLTRSMLADMGCIDISQLRVALRSATQLDGQFERGAVLNALALEYWLRVRSGRWTNQGSAVEHSAARSQAVNSQSQSTGATNALNSEGL